MNATISMPTTFPVACHTDFVGKDSTFVAIEGYADNGVNYIKKAVEKGARTIVVHRTAFLDQELCEFLQFHGVVVERVDNTRKALAQLSAQAAEFPAKKLNIIGITGTKGKTTTSFLLAHILESAGYTIALISSAQNRVNGNTFAVPLTTPQPDYLQQFLKLCVDISVDYVVMEVAAQALTLSRVHGITFCGVIFTNFSHEHLEFYPDLNEYFRTKCLIFDQIAHNAPILINQDNAYCAQLSVQKSSVMTYGFGEGHRNYFGKLVTDTLTKIALHVSNYAERYDFECTSLFGTYNAYNVLAATSMALALRLDGAHIQKGLQTFPGVPGRLQEYVLSNGARCFIDYAHNPESFQAVLSTLRLLTSQLIVVFGAGGGKDKFKRPIMGLVAAEIADIVVISSDNPRLEDPVAIAVDILRGIPEKLQKKIVQELDRKKAIEYAYQLSDQGSIIALLGKGPDEYQIIGTTKYYFSERSIVEQL
jgi:UDP-N-acetylmuramoyl-L-alanyl-D-glutamate--2,6-diaminopimelate ligase